MGTIQKFEDIEAWRKAREMTRQIYNCQVPDNLPGISVCGFDSRRLHHFEKDNPSLRGYPQGRRVFYFPLFSKVEPAKPVTSQIDGNQVDLARNGTQLGPSGPSVSSVQKGAANGQKGPRDDFISNQQGIKRRRFPICRGPG